MPSPPIEIGVLGPLHVQVRGAPLRLGSQKVRALLAALVLDRDSIVSADRLAEAMWGDSTPRTVTHALHVHVSTLRRAFRGAGPDCPVTTGAAGYRLDTSPSSVGESDTDERDRAVDIAVDIDVDRFEGRIADGRAAIVADQPEEALELLADAQRAWRGDPYVELADDPRAGIECSRLHALLLDAEEEWSEAGLLAGRDAEMLPALEAALADQPLRERRARQLMVALYRAGRAPDALRVYQRTRRRLVDELGLEPGPMLRDAELAVLTNDPTLFPVRSPTGALGRPEGIGRFVGRAGEWALLNRTVASTVGGSGRMVLVSGPPGIGKTRLVNEVATAAGPLLVARGACPDGMIAPPLWPIVDAVRDLGRDALPPPGHGLDDEILLPLRDAVAGRSAPVAAGRLPADDHAAFRLHDAIAELLVEIGRRAPLLLVLDDIHAADGATLGVLCRLATRVEREPVVVLATHRDTPADHTEAFSAARAVLARASAVERMLLGPLDHDDVHRYLTAAGLDADALGDAVAQRCEGSPLFLTELVDLLSERGGAPGVLDQIPDGLAAVLRARLELLGQGRRVVEQAAVLGTRFSMDILVRVTDAGTDELLRALTAATDLGLIEEEGLARCRFRHALVAETAAAGLPADSRADLHLRVAEALERTTVADPTMVSTEAARHRIAALPAGDPIDAANACLAAGELAHAAFADNDTAWFAAAARRALALCSEPDQASMARALILEGEAKTVLGQDAGALLAAALDAARRTGDPELVGHAVRALTLNRSAAAGAGDPDTVAMLESAIAGLDGYGGWLPVQLATDLAMTLYRTADSARSVALTEDALRTARAAGDLVGVAFALTGLHQAIWEARTTERRRALADEAIATAHDAGLSWHESMAYSFRAADLWEFGDVAGALRDIDLADELAHKGHRARFRWMATTWRALHAISTGDRARADELIPAALRHWGDRPNPDAVLCESAQRLTLALLDERVDDFIPIAHHQLATDAEPLFWHALLAILTSINGDHDETARSVDHVYRAGVHRLLPTVTRLPALMFLAEAAAAVGHDKAARAVGTELLPYAGKHVVFNVYGGGGMYWGVADAGLALAAATVGDADAARRWRSSAEDQLVASGAMPFLERARRRPLP